MAGNYIPPQDALWATLAGMLAGAVTADPAAYGTLLGDAAALTTRAEVRVDAGRLGQLRPCRLGRYVPCGQARGAAVGVAAGKLRVGYGPICQARYGIPVIPGLRSE